MDIAPAVHATNLLVELFSRNAVTISPNPIQQNTATTEESLNRKYDLLVGQYPDDKESITAAVR